MHMLSLVTSPRSSYLEPVPLESCKILKSTRPASAVGAERNYVVGL